MACSPDQYLVQTIPVAEDSDRLLCADQLSGHADLHCRHGFISVLGIQAGCFHLPVYGFTEKCTGKRFYGIHYLTHLYHAAFISSDDGRFIQTDSSKTGWY